MNIAELEARKDAVWEAYVKLVAAASASQHGSLAELAYQRAHGLITDPDPEGFKTFEAEVAAAEKAHPVAAKAEAAPDEAQEVEYADEEAEDEEEEAREASHEPHHKAAKTHRHK